MEFIIVEQPQPFVMTIRLNRDKALNALSIALLVEIADVLREAEVNDEIRCVVLTGSERAFSAGADIKEMPKDGIPMFAERNRLLSWKTIDAFKKPLIAAVNGWAPWEAVANSLLYATLLWRAKTRDLARLR